MIGYQYTYSSLEEIFTDMTLLSKLNIVEIFLLLVLCLILFLSVWYIIPASIEIYKDFHEQRQKDKRKKLLTQIATQREIEEEVEREIQMEEESKIKV